MLRNASASSSKATSVVASVAYHTSIGFMWPSTFGLAATRTAAGKVELTWDAAADFESGLAGFRILRDGKEAFLGSQSLRRLELDSRREIGVIFRNQSVVKALAKVFEKDWRGAEAEEEATPKDLSLGKAASRKIKKVVSKSIPVTPVVKQVVKAIQRKGNLELLPKEVEETVKIAVKEAVKDSVKDATKQALKSVVDVAEVARTR